MLKSDWNLSNIPPKGDPDVAEFALEVFEIAREEKERLGKPQNFITSYAFYRGQSTAGPQTGRKGYSPKGRRVLTPINLYFANVERTVSNITARIPTGEVVDMDGIQDGIENAMSMQLKKWWKDTKQQIKTRSTARQMEMYGITVEKPVRDPATNQPDILLQDPFSFFPAPGNWTEIATEAPYIAYVYLDYISKIETDFNVKDIAPEEAYDLMGQSREEFQSQNYGPNQTIGNYADPVSVKRQDRQSNNKKIQRGILIEVWLRDLRETTEKVENPVIDQTTGQQVIDPDKGPLVEVTTLHKKVYPDGIRKITISKSKDPNVKSGWIVLDDCANPNINFRHNNYGAKLSNTYPWGRLPVYIANSYKDGVSIWGFTAAEQVGDLIVKINLIVSKLIAYVLNVMAPPLIVQKHCGITRDMIESSLEKTGRLILMPSTPSARIEFMKIPNLPETFFRVLDLIIKLFDRVYQIEDADRGVGPTGVIAASAIVALQERNQVLMQAKTSAIDTIAEERSRWAIGIWQNFGTEADSVEVAGEQVMFRPVDYVNRRFNFVVESGSTTPRTSLQIQEDAKWLATNKFIGQKGLLKALNWPGWKQEIEETAESQIDQALQIMVDAGLPEEVAIKIREFVMSSQIQNTGGGGNPPTTTTKQTAATPQGV